MPAVAQLVRQVAHGKVDEVGTDICLWSSNEHPTWGQKYHWNEDRTVSPCHHESNKKSELVIGCDGDRLILVSPDDASRRLVFEFGSKQQEVDRAKNNGSGEWVLMMRQTVDGKSWWQRDLFTLDPTSDTAPNMARLHQLEDYRHPDSGSFELKLCWPGSGLEDQVWRQSSNPYSKRSRGVEGYEPVNAPHSAAGWGGIQYDQGAALLSGSSTGEPLKSGHWFYALGSYQEFNGGIPSVNNVGAKQVELWVKSPKPAIPLKVSVSI